MQEQENGSATHNGSGGIGQRRDANPGPSHDEGGDLIVAHKQTGGIDDPSASAPHSGTRRKYALDVCIRAEVDPKSPEGRTLAYGFSIPFLES